mmetsp:Transcript_24671/g.60021  ORF Transcript_24671/g.60021 Transcript_24671/m.60021 type:complete len:252 (-) Transcript_24671:366-1121(-)
MLSRLPRRMASCTSSCTSMERAAGTDDDCRRDDTHSTASLLVNTSHRPSLAMMRNASLVVSSSTFTSGSLITNSPVNSTSSNCTSFQSLMRMSPMLRVTPRQPLTRDTVTQPTSSSVSSSISSSSRPSAYSRGTLSTCAVSTQPPHFSTRAASSGRDGLWSRLISYAAPSRANTARQSPALPTYSVRPRTSATHAVVPLKSSSSAALRRNARLVSTNADVNAPRTSSRNASLAHKLRCRCLVVYSTAPRPL